jgi:hypothetical protein
MPNRAVLSRPAPCASPLPRKVCAVGKWDKTFARNYISFVFNESNFSLDTIQTSVMMFAYRARLGVILEPLEKTEPSPSGRCKAEALRLAKHNKKTANQRRKTVSTHLAIYSLQAGQHCGESRTVAVARSVQQVTAVLHTSPWSVEAAGTRLCR